MAVKNKLRSKNRNVQKATFRRLDTWKTVKIKTIFIKKFLKRSACKACQLQKLVQHVMNAVLNQVF